MDTNEFDRKRRNVIQCRRRRLLKKKAIEYKGGKCIECGYDKYQSAMVFHHPDSKDFNISSASASSWETIKSELDKCVLLCANCHNELHEKEHTTRFEFLEAELDIKERDGTWGCRKCGVRFERRNDKRPYCGGCAPDKRVTLDETKVLEMVSRTSMEEIAESLGCKLTTLKTFCYKRGIRFGDQNRFKIEWPSDEILQSLVVEKSMLKIAKQLGVSDKAVSKRCKARGIILPEKKHWAKVANEASRKKERIQNETHRPKTE